MGSVTRYVRRMLRRLVKPSFFDVFGRLLHYCPNAWLAFLGSSLEEDEILWNTGGFLFIVLFVIFIRLP